MSGGEKKYWDKRLSKKKRVLSQELQRFIDEMELLFGEDGFTITSAQRTKGQLSGDKDKNYSHHWKEGGSDAVDFRPNKKLYNYLQNTKEGLLLMKKYGIALLDETSKVSMEINKSTGAHFHIGKDSKYTAIRDSRLKNIESGEIKVLNPHNVLAGYFPKKESIHNQRPEEMFKERTYIPDLSMVKGSDNYKEPVFGSISKENYTIGKGFISKKPKESNVQKYGGDPSKPLVGYNPNPIKNKEMNDNDPTKKNKKTFEEAYRMAEKAGAKFPSIVAAQFGLETAWGTKTAGAKNNLFNLKYHEPTARKMRAMGLNVKKSPNAVLDKATGSTDHYMEFESEEDAFKGYMTFLEVNPRYADALKASTPEEYITELKKAGYAEDKLYVSKILNISKQAKDFVPATPKGKANKKSSEKAQSDAVSQYKKDVAEIKKTHKLSEGNRKAALNSLNREYYKKGFITEDGGIINDEIIKRNKESEDVFNVEKEDFKIMYEMLGKSDILYRPSKDDETKQKISSMSITSFTSDEGDKYKAIIKKYPEFFTLGTNGTIKIHKEKFLPHIEDKYKEYTYNELDLIGDDGFTRGKDLSIDVNAVKTRMAKIGSGSFSGTTILEKSYNEEGSKGFVAEEDGGESIITINPEWDNEIKKEEAQKPTTNKTTTTPKTENESASKVDYYSDDFYGFESATPTPKTYDASQMKNNIPIAEMAIGLSGAIAGLAGANKDTPRRDEELNGAFIAYTHDLKRISQIGLMPEEEAYAKQMLSESYHTGVESIVRASGGNRNVVLANLGRLDAQQSKGLANIALADAKAKREGMYKYGEAMKYVSEFDAKKDIANNNRDYQEALLDKEASSNLASAGFTALLDEMAYYRENAPGSAMSILKSIYFQDNLGYDPRMKDDGTEKQGTKSAYDAQMAKVMEYKQAETDRRNIWNNLTPEKKSLVDKFNMEQGFGEKSDQFLDFMGGQNGTPKGDFNFKKMGEVKDGNFSPIFEESKQFSEHVNPLQFARNQFTTTGTPFESTFEKEKRESTEKGLSEFNPLENPFPEVYPKFGEELTNSEMFKTNNYVKKE